MVLLQEVVAFANAGASTRCACKKTFAAKVIASSEDEI
jgi:hypothetical protein